jgi:hypothetical protein
MKTGDPQLIRRIETNNILCPLYNYSWLRAISVLASQYEKSNRVS